MKPEENKDEEEKIAIHNTNTIENNLLERFSS